jgi:hypothetical protein
VDEARVAGLEGFEKLEQDYRRALDALDKQEKDAKAVGIADDAQYWSRRLELQRDYDEKRKKLIDDMVDLDLSDVFPALGNFDENQDRFTQWVERQLNLTAGDEERARRARLEGARDYSEELLKQSAIIQKTKDLQNAGYSDDDAKAIAEDLVGQIYTVRENMRSAVKDGIMEGIRTDDWGQAFRDILANALTNLLIGNGSSNNSGLVNSAINWFAGSFGGGRAIGGPVSPGTMYKVGENGPEILRMGSMGGQVLTAAQVNGPVAPGKGASGAIDASVNFYGPIGADLQEVKQLLANQKFQIMQAMPYVVDARVIDSKRHRRYK